MQKARLRYYAISQNQKSISFSKYRLASLWAFEATDALEEYFIEAKAAAILTASFTLIPEDWLQYSVISTKIIY